MSDEQFLVILIMHVLSILAVIKYQGARPQVISIDKDSGDVTFTVRKPQ